MRLSLKLLSFFKPRIDQWMSALQRDDDVSFEEWKELQSKYNNLYGKDYERTN